MARRRRFYDFFEAATPRQARGGIKAQTKRGRFGESWWAKRWIGVLESLLAGGRLKRGKNYARRGQVLSVDVLKGVVSADVQGSRRQPYRVSIRVKTLSRRAWEKLAEVLSQKAVFAAKLLAGDMPENVEEAFEEAGLALFPTRGGDLTTSCSCPDWSNPCKHIAAVYYLLGEEFDRDPFLIFKLRGMEREELAGLVGGSSAGGQPEEIPISSPPAEPISAEPELFWGQPAAEDSGVEARVPDVDAALPRRLGSFPFWRGENAFLPTLQGIYREASSKGLEVVLAWTPRRFPG